MYGAPSGDVLGSLSEHIEDRNCRRAGCANHAGFLTHVVGLEDADMAIESQRDRGITGSPDMPGQIGYAVEALDGYDTTIHACGAQRFARARWRQIDIHLVSTSD